MSEELEKRDPVSYSDIYVGPSPEYQRQKQEESLRAQTEDLLARGRDGDRKLQEMYSRYGEDLVDVGIAYKQRHAPSSYGFVHFQGGMVRVEEIRTRFANELASKVGSMPRDEVSLAGWLGNFFTDLDSI